MVKLSDFSEHIQKSFTSPEKEKYVLVGKIRNQLKTNLEKGFIDEDTFKKAGEQLDNLVKAKKGEGSKGGHVIGHTKSGKAVYAGKNSSHPDYKHFTAEDHEDASSLHGKEVEKHNEMKHKKNSLFDQHQTLAEHHLKENIGHANEAKKKSKESLSPDEKKILADQKKKQIKHHEEMHQYHTILGNMASKHLEKHKDSDNEKYMREAAVDHYEKAAHHKSEKERLENEKKGY